MPTEEQKDNEEREGGELGAGTARGDASESADEGDEGTVSAAAESSEAAASGRDEGASDEGADDDASGDDASSDEDDEDEAEPSAAASHASASSAAAKKAAARASAGARLAAAKAAKAAKKAAKKAQIAAEAEAESGDSFIGSGGGMPAKDPTEILAESSIGQAATKASEWASTNRSLAAGIVAVLVVGALGWVGYAWWNASQAEGAGALLENALDIANAEVVASEDADADADEPTFATREARAEAALTAYRQVITEYPGAEAARWARLGEAKALFDLGRNEEAREVYERALREAGGDAMVAWRALEGIGFTYEADQQWDQAIEQYQELRSIDDGAYEAPADYHIARMRIAKGERVEAATALRALVERLRPEEATEEPTFPFVLAQAEVRLRELDPGSGSGSGSPMMIGPGGAGGGGLPPGLEGIDPQILEQLRRQLGAGAGGEGAPE